VRVRERRRTGRIPACGGARDPAALLARPRPPVRGRQRPYGSRALLLVDAEAGILAGRFLSISTILRAAPARYARSFLYVETDAGDTTYFVLSQLRVVCRAIEEFQRYLERKVREVRELERRLRLDDDLNHRQRALLAHALRHPYNRYTYRSHARSHGVTHESARHDLQDLSRRGLLEQRRSGREHVFYPVPGIEERLGAAG